MSGSGTDAHRLSRQAFTALQAFIALVGSRFGAVCMRRCIDVQSARVIIYVHGVCVCVCGLRLRALQGPCLRRPHRRHGLDAPQTPKNSDMGGALGAA